MTPPGSGSAATPPVGDGASPSAVPIASTREVRFLIQAPPSLNVQKKWRNVGQVKAFRDALVYEMVGAIPRALQPTSHQRLLLATNPVKRVVVFTRFWFVGKVGEKLVNVKELDPDNFVGSCKPVLDELKLVTWRRREFGQMVERPGFGFIVDDRSQYCQAMYDQQRNPARAGKLEVRIT